MRRRRQSAGILLYERRGDTIRVFLVHPGGPLFARKDAGVWSLPKGEYGDGEDPLQVARREFAEETGRSLDGCAPSSEPVPLGEVTQRGGKVVTAWAVEGTWPEGTEVESNRFEMEWPPRSGRRQSFPEVDRGAFFTLDEAREKVNPAQAAFLDRLADRLSGVPRPNTCGAI